MIHEQWGPFFNGNAGFGAEPGIERIFAPGLVVGPGCGGAKGAIKLGRVAAAGLECLADTTLKFQVGATR